MKETKFSVSMCVYGKDDPRWFETAVESILHQTAKPAEVVLVVDGPVPPELDTVIKKYEADILFTVIRFEKNQGHGNARRASLAACTNELVALMDADDISAPDRFEKQLAAFDREPDVAIIGGDIAEFIGTPDNIVAYRRVPAKNEEIMQYMKKRCPFNQMTVMFKKSIYEQAGGYLDWYCDEDYYLWLRMMQTGARFANIGEILVRVRVGKEMYQRRGGWEYFKSEAKLQSYMLQHRIISISTYLANIGKRLVVQVLLPDRLRGWVFQKFARKRV